jgi:hypothetical protein
VALLQLRLECGRSWVFLRSGQTKDYQIGMCCFSAKHAALRRKSKDWLARNQNNVSSGVTCLPADCCNTFILTFLIPDKNVKLYSDKRWHLWSKVTCSMICHFCYNCYWLDHVENKLHSMKLWWWCLLCTRPTHFNYIFMSVCIILCIQTASVVWL